MLHDYIGDDDFRQGLHNYLMEYSYKNTVTENLASHLTKISNKPINEIMPSNSTYPELTGDLLTATSERIVKKVTLDLLTDNTDQDNITMSNPMQDSAMMICYRECLTNLGKFPGDDNTTILQFITNIERIGKMIEANDDILYCMCTAKLDGEAKRWYENNMSLTQWQELKLALLERFTSSVSSSKLFEQLKDRKQRPDETVTSYYDAIIKLCHEYDPSMSQKMKISWLENGINDSLKIQIKRQMKLLSESQRTTQAFLKIAKDEQELQEENVTASEPTSSHTPYFSNAVSTTLHQTNNTHSNVPTHPVTINSQSPTPPNRTSRPQRQNITPHHQSNTNTYKSSPCYICKRNNHRFLLTGTRDGGDSSITKQIPSPIYINVQVNNKRQHAIIDTGSAVTIISKQLLSKIDHRKFKYKRKLHKSANCTSINIIGEIELEVQIQGYKSLILADVATNLITDLLLGNDWIAANNVVIDSPQQHIFIMNNQCRLIATAPFLNITSLQQPVLLINEIVLPPYSEQIIDVQVSLHTKNVPEVLFEPASSLYSKHILLTNALVKVENNRSKLLIMNVTNRERMLQRNTKLGHASSPSEINNYFTLPVFKDKQHYQKKQLTTITDRRNSTFTGHSCATAFQHRRKTHFMSLTCHTNNYNEQPFPCYVCEEKFLSHNDLQHHLRQQCYPEYMRQQIDLLTQHIQDPKQRQRLQNILWKHGKLFDLRQPSIIKATVRHAIDTSTHPPIYTPPYRVSYKDEQLQREEIDKLLKQGIIEESVSPWSSPIVLVKKKDGSVRFCIDFRKLNNITTKDAFPMPRIDDIFDHLSQAEYYTTIDFKSGYFQVGLDPKDRPKTAFSTRDQHYQFTVLPQGVTNGPPAFQRIVSQILGSTRWQYSLAYLDDVIIYSPTFDQHLIHLDDILTRLNDANFRLNVNKCQIARTSIDYLGHNIEHRNIRPNADNIRALEKTSQPTTAKEAFRFVKAAEYYRKFIPNFSTIAQPLHKYAPTTKDQRLKKSQATPITLSDDELNAFNTLKRILTYDLVLRIPNPNLPFKIHTDASRIGIGAVLMQTHSNGDLPVAYLSKKFTATQMNWPATEQECYAIIYAIEKWHKYLDGRPFVIETDHKPLLPFNLKQQLNAKCERWRLKLQQYQFTIRYIKGKHNTVADYLSRSPVENESIDEDDHIITNSKATQTDHPTNNQIIAPVITRAQAKRQVNSRPDCPPTTQACDSQQRRNIDLPVEHSCSVPPEQLPRTTNNDDVNKILPFTLEHLKELQYQDVELKNIIDNIHRYPEYVMENDILMKNASTPVPVVPKGRIRSDIIKIYHDTPANGAHFGRTRTVQKIQQRYFWPNMTSGIKNHIKSCIPCLQNNHLRRKPPGTLQPIKPPEGIWQLLTMDFHGPITPTTKQGNRYIISLTDVMSKFVIAKAVRDATATTAAHFLTEEVILKYGTPKCILTDNGTHFTAEMMNQLFKKLGIVHLYSTPYHPMTNGQVERYNATMDSKIAALSNEKRTDWDQQLPFVTFNYNTTIHTTSGFIPFEMMYGRLPILPFDQQDPIVKLTQDADYIKKLKNYLNTLTEDARKNILQQQQEYKQRYDRNRINPQYKMNDLVLIKSLNRHNKFDVRYEGPFRITQQLGKKTFIVVHVNKPTLTRQVTIDVIIPLYERKNVD
ncbi:unnamed protein product [Rotaria sp. Silwood2]|nr:unnamed protein product [Rotaria sp. Silwood2]